MSKKRIRAERTTLLNWGGEDREVIVLPATAEAYEQMVEQAAVAIAEYRNWKGAFYTDVPINVRETYRGDARAALRAIGITPPKKQTTVPGS